MKLTLAVACTLVAALMLFPNVAAGTETVYVTDRIGDLGHPMFVRVVDGMIDPASFWPDNSPVGKATYLDVTRAWMTADDTDDSMTAGLEMMSTIPLSGPLPQGVKTVWYLWWFYLDTLAWNADFRLVVSWDGEISFAYLTDTSNHEATLFPSWTIDSYDISGNVVTAEVDRALISGTVAWFFEVVVWNANPVDPEEQMPAAGWYAVDMTDSPADTLLPWWPLPS